jgi:hypothetical protein
VSPVDAFYSYLRPYFPNGGLRLAEVVLHSDHHLIFLGCGAIINRVEGFSGLRLAVVDHAILHTIAFTAKHFHPAFTCHLFIAFAQLVVIECFPLCEAFPMIIEQSGLGMHTDIMLMNVTSRDGGSLMSLECICYSWAHSNSRPWGKVLPLQCPQCGCPTNWKRLKANFSGKFIIFECSFANCGRVKDKSEAEKPRQRLSARL